jgi:hypothetical protein
MGGCSIKKIESTASPVSHQIWDALVRKHVTPEGWVNYSGFKKDSTLLNQYTSNLERHHPNDKNWSKNEQLAYWINAYNAYTVKLIVDHYPVSGIKEIKKGIPFVNTVWDIKFIKIEDQTYDLNNIEHGILRKHFDEPRIHFAINCASVSCPKLANYAYLPEKLNQQLHEAALSFLNDPLRNQIQPDDLRLSRIFSWFKGDFTKKGSLHDFINQYIPVSPDAPLEFLEYNWNLNDLPKT